MTWLTICVGKMKCLSCENEANPFNWFCEKHYKIKEDAYKEAKNLGLKTHNEVIKLRDKRLLENK